MRLPPSIQGPVSGCGRSPEQAFTLAEVLVAMAIFGVVVGGIMTAHLFGLQMFQLNQTKLVATEWSRNTFGKIADEVRSCNAMYVGNVDGTNSSFDGLLSGEPQQGNGLIIYPSTDTNTYILYFLNAADQTFRRTTEQPGSAAILANYVTNTPIFTAQDFMGNVLTSGATSNNPVIHLTLDFNQPPLYQQNAFAYKLETSMTRHILQ